MTLNPAIMKAVEQSGYRVTVGDVAAKAGLEVNLAQQGLLALASDAGGHMQVSDVGEIVYLFPKDFRVILRNKYWQLQLKEWWEKVWKVVFYLIRISFGIVLIASIVLMTIAILIILSSSRDNENSSDRSDGRGMIFLPSYWDIFWILDPGYDYNRDRYRQQSADNASESRKQMNFLEAIFSFLFGDGNPNFNLEERRWQQIGTVIRNSGGAVVAQQIAPYLDNINAYNSENEDYILPVLARFNGYPQVSPAGEIIYYFPQLQVTARKQEQQSVAPYLREKLWRFSEAGGGQITLAVGLGIAQFVLAIILGSLLRDYPVAGGLIGFVSAIYWVLLAYATGFLVIPAIRYFWIQWRNSRIQECNQKREARAALVSNPDAQLRQKLDYARQFANQKVITNADITYSTEKDLLEQESERSDKIDEEWRRRLESGF
ncbi:MAG: hypothetical protein IGR93_06650 [Hydrococcus sp. C42_A2020_068]|uniref:hypothetical protein n=1 Tax=Pleurocapsa sp. PCC 7327 TaxID=118163 RepID=UPI00029FD4FA|nr:hypothetical protein [Pleurocapsa sp. PCC 7327]AFY76829.1 hypothetical protein Ple7327_1444 [Pleurocapsa sp. PCC 7327]MBF2019776.1 hypothetical protein [Hydrococcus sp. C42_A2020_068]